MSIGNLRASMLLLVVGLVAMGSGAPAVPAASPQVRVLYAGDWNGPMQIFASDPTGR